MPNNKNDIRTGLITGSSVICCMLSGQLFLENIKMERQRTSLSYPRITKNLIKQGTKGYLSGFLPWGVMLGFGKGFVVGSVSSKVKKECITYKIDNKKTAIYSGILTGISEALYTNPIFMARSKINANLTKLSQNNIKSNWKSEINNSFKILNKTIKKNGITSIYNGLPILVCKRMTDWIARFYMIEQCKNYIRSNSDDYELTLKDKFISTAIGSALATPLSIPFDRLLPVIYNSNNLKEAKFIIKEKIKKEGIKTFYRGLFARTLSTVHYTLFALFIPQLINEYI